MLKIHFVNHASVLIDLGEVKVLTDPWYFGNSFENGWGLRYDNPKALEIAKTATHLWISHFHADHYHVPTLKKILEINPEIILFGNRSLNFQLDLAAKKIGFMNVIPFLERKAIKITDDIEIIRYPTTGIDNMLLVKTNSGTILNYNDCSIPPLTRKWLKKELGTIDVLLTNYNHAGKLLTYPYPDDKKIKDSLLKVFSSNFDIFNPKFILPFASHHYYKAPESIHQNSSMLTVKDLVDIDNRIVNFDIGDIFTFDNEAGDFSVDNTNRTFVTKNKIEPLIRSESVEFDALKLVSIQYVKNLRSKFGFFVNLMPKFLIRIKDLNITVNLNVKKGIELIEATDAQTNITLYSESMYKWFKNIYGTDSFVVGAHFQLNSAEKIPLKWQIILGILIDNKIDLSSLVRMMFTLSGLSFLLNRREEIIGILLSGRLHAEYHD